MKNAYSSPVGKTQLMTDGKVQFVYIWWSQDLKSTILKTVDAFWVMLANIYCKKDVNKRLKEICNKYTQECENVTFNFYHEIQKENIVWILYREIRILFNIIRSLQMNYGQGF